MDTVYSLLGVCPQHDLLWETLTGANPHKVTQDDVSHTIYSTPA